jgi:uncharacterized coiled-coil DUF342 family protein
MESNPVVTNPDELYAELEELKSDSVKKKSEITGFRKQIETTLKERDALNVETKKASNEIKQLKAKRDSLNAKVKELKQKRDELQAAAAEKRVGLTKLLEQARRSSEQLEGSMSDLLKQIKRLEWFIQTNPLSPKTERSTVAKVAVLEVSLAKHKVLKNVKDRLLQLRIEVGGLRLQAQSIHEQLTAVAKESEKVHETMQETVKLFLKKKKEADLKHEQYIEQSKERQALVIALRKNIARAEQIRSQVGELQASTIVEKAKKVKSKYKESADEKMKSGGRLSFEEFQALMGDSTSDDED